MRKFSELPDSTDGIRRVSTIRRGDPPFRLSDTCRPDPRVGGLNRTNQRSTSAPERNRAPPRRMTSVTIMATW